MVLSNAERQARYRARVKELASLDKLGEQAERAVDQAIEALWTACQQASDKQKIVDVGGAQTIDEYRRSLALAPQNLIQSCRLALGEAGLSDDQRRALTVVVDTFDAVTLAR